MGWLKELRIAKGLTGSAVSAEAGITQQMYNYVENGKRSPSVTVAKRIAAVLGFDWTRFFDDEKTV